MITVYTREGCVHCEAAKNLLQRKGISYVEKKIGVDVSREDLSSLYPNVRTTPVVVDDDKLIGGSDNLREYVLRNFDRNGKRIQ
jgi:glutaredoxin 3